MWKQFLLCCFFAAVDASPNIILILTDDQDVTLRGMTPMKNTQKLVANEGVTFLNAFTSSPICCPSRASILTGQYAHNHKTYNNSMSGGCFGTYWQENGEKTALPVLFKSLKYTTFFAGKYLNEYRTASIPPGWDQWFGLFGNSVYYNYTINKNGQILKNSSEYLTDYLRDRTVDFIKNYAAKGPFFAMVAPPAPHKPFTPAPRHMNTFPNVKALRTPNFNRPSGPLDKHWLLTMPPKVMSNKTIELTDEIYRHRWQSLLAVDEMVRAIIVTLEKANLMENTYVVFSSDNGFHTGQFAQAYDKRQPYETDIRVPLIVRGPNVRRKAISASPVVLIDLVPTFLEWAKYGGNVTQFDGLSFDKDLRSDTTETDDRQILIEYWGEGTAKTHNPECGWSMGQRLYGCDKETDCTCIDAWNNTYSCVRHFSRFEDYIYCEFTDRENFVEAYDLKEDPFQMNNLGFEMLPSEHAMYTIALANLKVCSGKSCTNAL